MPALPKRCKTLRSRLGGERSSPEEILPRTLQAHAFELQLRQLAERFRSADLGTLREVVYMSGGPFVQQLPQAQALFVDHLLVGLQLFRLPCGRGGEPRIDLALRL